MCRVLGRPELVEDPRFASHELLTENAPAAADIIAEELGSRTFEECKKVLHDFSGQWAPVQDTLEIVDDPQVQANGYVLETQTADGKPFKLVTSPVQFDEQPVQPLRGPEFNEHGDQILAEDLGLDWDTIVDLKVKGVVA
jgi:crotonobetainyl-CoA:carnitine CoA-transferase CaiB-like acyl-CoA transferase